ncbi:MAG: phosphoglucosamine mutase [Clostridia bacterium]|nr:phosphoglucosamine mutase [Clostridia bacterium]
MQRLFGTDGVRGIAGTGLSCQMAYDLGRAGAHVLTDGAHHPKILVGRDTRISGQMLESALCAGICSTGAKVLLVDVMPTPAIAYLTRKYNADAGVVISASHNPMEYNGIKFFNSKGYKLSDEIEDRIQSIIDNGCREVEVATGAHVGGIEDMKHAEDDYIDYLVSLNNTDLSTIKVAIDCANGAASSIAPKLLDRLNVQYVAIFDHPNGININDNCGSTHMENLSALVRDTKCDIGLAFDGDADRMLAVDENGELIDGDQIMAIFAREMMKDNTLKDNTLVATVMSNLGLTIFAREAGINMEVTKVGDRYVLEKMIEKGYSLGGEQSGHIIFLNDNTTGDGVLSGLRLLEALAKNSCQSSKLSGIMSRLPQVLVNVTVSEKKKHEYGNDKEIADRIDSLDKKYAGSGRVLIRPSGTENLVRVMIEGVDQDVIKQDAESLAELIKKNLV